MIPPGLNLNLGFPQEAFSADLRTGLILLAVSVTAAFFYEDFKDREIPRWLPPLTGLGIVGFWFFYLDLPSTYHILLIGIVGLLAYTFTKLPLTLVGKIAGVGEGDAQYAAILTLLLPSPVLWGSPGPFIPSYFSFFPIDYVINMALVFLIFGIAAKIVGYLKEDGLGLIPFTPVVTVVWVATVFCGAWWRPVLMPVVRLFL